MKKLLLLLLCVPLMFSCGENQEDNKEIIIRRYHIDESYASFTVNYDSTDIPEHYPAFLANHYNDTLRYLIKDSSLVSGIIFSKYNDGQLKFEKTYKDGKLDGLIKRWYENGQLSSEGNYKEGIGNFGVIESYLKPRIVTFGDGIRFGLHKGWYENGQLAGEGNYINHKRDGLHKNWYENGQLKSEGNFINDNEDGLHKNWYENGQLKSEGNFNGKKGLIRDWDITYDENGKSKTEFYWEETILWGRKHGLWKYYDVNGQLKSEENYNDGIEIELTNKVTPEVRDNKDSDYEIKGYEEGKKIFEGVCKMCHTIGGGELVGQDLKGVLDRMSAEDFINFTQNPASKGVTTMLPQDLSADEIKSILEYITNYVEEETEEVEAAEEGEEW